MKKPEGIHVFLQRVDAELTKNRNEIKKTRKTIARLNRYVQTLRKRLKKHSDQTSTEADSAVIHLNVPTNGKNQRRFNAIMFRI